MADVFEVPGAPWTPVSRRLSTVRLLTCGGATVVGLLVLAAAALWLPIPTAWVTAAAALGVVAAVAAAVLLHRNARSWAYAERADDIYIRRGVAFLRLEVVPYGRMQLVDVKAGPLERRLGIADVTLHTASPDTNARIVGLPFAEAERLRDRLTALGEAQAAGL
ncbi:MAG: PH domain-containing protein [Nocardioidaceae bacterium]